jgi:hypothetical protein
MRITEYLFDLSEGFDEILDKKIDNFLKILDMEHKVDDIWEIIKNSLKNYRDISENEIIIEAYYGIAYLLENDYKIDSDNIDIFINGLTDSYLHIKDKEGKNIELGNFQNNKEFMDFYFENYYLTKDKKEKIKNILNKLDFKDYEKFIYEKCKETFLEDLTID